MRKIALALGMAVACMTGGWAADARAGEVYLDGPASLAQLRASNPIHYQRALKIIDAANELCRPKAGELEYARFDAKNISSTYYFHDVPFTALLDVTLPTYEPKARPQAHRIPSGPPASDHTARPWRK